VTAITMLMNRMPHFLLTALMACFVSCAIAMLERRNRRERVYRAGYLWFCCLASVIGGSWVMHFIHG
jgi:NO-binding membrane sensor protein with MHYT domain